MASSYVTSLNKLLHFLLFITITGSSKLNVPHVLLPIFNDVNVNFTLEAANGGCYKWSTTRIDLVQLTYIDPNIDLDCSQKAVVSAISKERTRNVAVVLAEEVNSQVVLRVDVILDVIDKLSISMTTKEIIMDEVPEVFKVVAFDNQGNQFTTLEGVEFGWKIISLGTNKDLTVLRFIQFRESPYETPPSIELFEQQNKRGHIVLLEGTKTGSAKVLVELPDEEYAHVKPYEVQLTVVANLIIIPADVYCMPYEIVDFKVFSMNNGKMEEIVLPSSQYYLTVENSAIASVGTNTGEVTALKEGNTRLLLHDRNLDASDPGLKMSYATMTVVTPMYMTLTLSPQNNWEILLSEHHVIHVEVFSRDNHKLYLGPTVELHTQVGEIFHIQHRSANGSWLTGWAHNEGVAPVQAVLEGIVHPRLGRLAIEPLTASRDLIIYPRVVLSPSEVILPWDPIAKPKYLVELTASGGDGKFLWSSSNHSIGTVNQLGQVRTYNEGFFDVTATMQRNHNNRESARVQILPPSHLEIVEYINEAEVGSTIFLHVALYADHAEKDGHVTHIPFTKCQELPFKVKTADSTFLYNKSMLISPVGISCANVAIIGTTVSSTKVTVTYNKDGKFLEDSVSVSTYEPLQLLHPTDDVVLAVGTTKQLIFTGGPRASASRPNDFKRAVKSDNINIVEAFDTTKSENLAGNDDYSVVRVLCRSLGEAEVTLSISNAPAVPSCKNPATQISVKVICAKPRSVSLHPEIKVTEPDSCPMDLGAEKVVVQAHTDVELDVIVREENGLRFLNISTFKFVWKITPEGAGYVKAKDRTFQRDKLKGSLNYGNKHYQIVVPKAGITNMEVDAEIVGYLRDYLKIHKINAEWPEFVDEKDGHSELPPLTTALGLIIVDDTVVTPNHVQLYNHPANKAILPIKQGSGYYKLVLSNDLIASVKYRSSSREIEISPHVDGELRVQLVDLCLDSSPALILVQVVSVHVIRVEMSDKVEINKCISCVVRLYDENDNLVALENMDMIDLRAEMELNIASAKRLVPDPDKPWTDGEVHYIITGGELGDTKVTFITTGTHEQISSAPLDLQVFPPLTLHPRNATMLVGSTLHYYNKGGPQPESVLEYSVVPDNIAELNENGMVKGLELGSAQIHARAIGTNPTTGQRVIYTEDDASVNVIPITGIKISSPLTRVKVGSKVPVWATGMPEQLSPMIIGTVEDKFTYNWAVDDPNIIQLQGVFETIGIAYQPEDQVSARFMALSPGKTKLRLNVTVPGVAANCPKEKSVVFRDVIDVEVFEGLALTEPKGVSGKMVLMAPHSSLQIKTNMDSTSKIAYKLVGEDSVDSNSQRSLAIPKPIVTITETGELKSHATIGYSMVLIIAYDEHGLKQTLSLIVEVKSIYYMLVSPVTNWLIQSDGPSDVIPLGVEFELHATYHDNTGHQFTAGTSQLHVRTSRFDLARVKLGRDNATLTVSIRKPGDTVLKVWADGVRKTADYVKLHVKQTVTPTVDHLVTGDVLCLWSPVTSLADKGQWSVSDVSLLDIDSSTGVGTAVATKSGNLAVSHSLLPAASLQISVLPISQIRLLNPEGSQSLTNSPATREVEVPLVIQSGESETRKNNLLTSWHCRDDNNQISVKVFPFICEISFTNSTLEIPISDIFTVKSGFNKKTGLYSCNIASTGNNDADISVLETNVVVVAKSVSNGVVSNPVELPFYPGLFFERDLSIDDSFMADFFVVGSDAVLSTLEIVPTDSSLLAVDDGVRVSSNTMKYQVTLLDYHWKLNEFDEPLTLQLHSKKTDERGKAHVKVQGVDRFNGRECSGGGHQSAVHGLFYSYRYVIAIVASMLVIFFVTFYAYSYYIQPIINVNITSAHGSLLTGARPGTLTARNHPGTPGSPGTPGTPGTQSAVLRTTLPATGCAANTSFLQRSPNASYGTNLTASYANREPVYGDPSSFYSTCPEVRRNRRLM